MDTDLEGGFDDLTAENPKNAKNFNHRKNGNEQVFCH
jgi:hypothetical protein